MKNEKVNTKDERLHNGNCIGLWLKAYSLELFSLLPFNLCLLPSANKRNDNEKNDCIFLTGTACD